MRRYTSTLSVLCLILCFALLPAAARKRPAVRTASCGDVNLDQGWTCEKRGDFWFRTQGSRILRYTWFLNLEQAASTTLFRDRAHMDALRFVLAPKSEHNPDGLPAGFTKDPAGCSGSDCWVGMTCAACHTARIDFPDLSTNKPNPEMKSLIVDGGAGMLDFTGFLNELVAALAATSQDPRKFDRFAAAVLGQGSTQTQQLREMLMAQTAELRGRADRDHPPNPYGFSRVDAFGAIFNQVLAYDLDIPENAMPANAPVSYPCLWDTHQHDKVQWNGSGASGILSLTRNIGEALGVFGTVQVTPRPGKLPVYGSSIGPNIKNLNQLEKSVTELFSPVWPRSLAAIKDDKAAAGKRVYDKLCEHCHHFIDRKDPLRHIEAKMVDVTDVQTDPAMAVNFAHRQGKTGRLQGSLKPPFVFGPRAGGAEILSNVIIGTALGGFVHGGMDRNIKSTPQFQEPKEQYKARPLNGVWATAPYLHNGSVRNLWQLLCAKREPTFRIGDRTFDPVNVGYVSGGNFVMDTTLPGNYSTGHMGDEYGTGLSSDDKWALIEFLKTL